MLHETFAARVVVVGVVAAAGLFCAHQGAEVHFGRFFHFLSKVRKLEIVKPRVAAMPAKKRGVGQNIPSTAARWSACLNGRWSLRTACTVFRLVIGSCL